MAGPDASALGSSSAESSAATTTPVSPSHKELPRRLRRAGLGFTGEGRIFLLMTVGIGAAAVNTGNNLLYLVLGLMLSLIILSGSLSDLVLWGIGVRRHLPRRAFAGSPCLVELELTNLKRWLPSFSLAASDELEGETPGKLAATAPRTYYLKLDPKGSQRAGSLRVPERRGVVRFARVRLATRYPFGFFDKWRLLDCADDLLVFPAIVAVPDLEKELDLVLGRDDAQAEARQRARAHGADVAGLRAYREGDEARAVHWRRSAALGSLVVRELERVPARELAIRLDLSEGTGTEILARHERLVSRAASLAILAHARGARVEVLARGERSSSIAPEASIDPLLGFLARVAPAGAETPMATPRRAAVVIDVVDAPVGQPTRRAAGGTP